MLPRLAFPRFVHIERAAIQLGAVEGFDCALCIFTSGEGNKTETAGAARVPIGNDPHFFNLAEGFKCFAKRLLLGIPT